MVAQNGHQFLLVDAAERFPAKADVFFTQRGLRRTGVRGKLFSGFGFEGPRLEAQDGSDRALEGADEPRVSRETVLFWHLVQGAGGIDGQALGRDREQRWAQSTVFAHDVLQAGLHAKE